MSRELDRMRKRSAEKIQKAKEALSGIKDIDKDLEKIQNDYKNFKPKFESFFDNVIFDEFTLLEGEQAEAYKKRKAEEKASKDRAEKERSDRRYSKKDINDLKYLDSVGKDPVYHHTGDKTDKSKSLSEILFDKKSNKKLEQDGRRGMKATETVKKEIKRRNREIDKAFDKGDEKEVSTKMSNMENITKDNGNIALDATNRHIRRHTKKEYAIFDDIEMI